MKRIRLRVARSYETLRMGVPNAEITVDIPDNETIVGVLPGMFETMLILAKEVEIKPVFVPLDLAH